MRIVGELSSMSSSAVTLLARASACNLLSDGIVGAHEGARAAHARAAVHICLPAQRLAVELLGAVIGAHRPVGEAAGDAVPQIKAGVGVDVADEQPGARVR